MCVYAYSGLMKAHLRTCTCARDSYSRSRTREWCSAWQVIALATPPLMQTLHACIMQHICRNKAHHQFYTSRERALSWVAWASIWGQEWFISGISVQHIVERLAEEDISISRSALYELLKKYSRCHTIADLKRAPQPRILQEEHYGFIDDTMAENMDLIARQLYWLFKEKFSTIETSMSTIKQARLELGWVCKWVKYCQLITEIYKEKRVTWCLERLTTNNLEMSCL